MIYRSNFYKTLLNCKEIIIFSKKPTDMAKKNESPKKTSEKTEKVIKAVKKDFKKLPELPKLNTMFAFSSDFQESRDSENRKSFRMLPVASNSSIVEIFWEPFIKALVVVTKDVKETFKTFPKLSASGHYLINKDKNTNQNSPYQQERILINEFNTHYIDNLAEIDQFLSSVVVNQEFNWKKYITV